MKKEIILVRHGRSETNHTEVHQAGDQVLTDALTEHGLEQARAVAQRFGNVAVGKIVSSPYLRARQTAQFIQEVTGSDIVVPVYRQGEVVDVDQHDEGLVGYRSLLRELDVPSELEGQAFHSAEAQLIKQEADSYMRDADKRYSDQENLFDQWERCRDIVNYLIRQPEKTIVVVSHGGILKYLIGHIAVCNEEALSYQQKVIAADNFSKLMWYDNTGITVLTYDDSDQQWQWLPFDIDHLHPKYFSIMPEAKKLTEEDNIAEK